MFSDENNPNFESPIHGTGDEMLPERGLPFDKDDIELLDESHGEGPKPRDLTPEELGELFSGETSLSTDFEGIEDAGMGAAEPVLNEDQLRIANIPPPNMDIPAPGLPDASSHGATVKDVISEDGLTGFFKSREGSSHLEETGAMMDLLISEKRLLDLWKRMDSARDQIKVVVPNIPIARELISQIERARNELMAGRKNYEEAEGILNEVELRIEVIRTAKIESKVGYALFVYELIWAILFTYGLIWVELFSSTSSLSNSNGIMLSSASWGGLGGIIGALYSLWKHVSRDVDFSKQYSLWYIVNPVMGIFLGAFVYLVMQTGMGAMYGAGNSQEITSAFMIYMIAFIVGYQQNVAWALIRRVAKVFQLLDEGGGDSVAGESS